LSWATLIEGAFRLKTDNKKIQNRILKDAEQLFECKVKYDKLLDTYFVDDLSWASHRSKEKIDKFIKKYRKYLAEFSMDLYFLTAPDESWNISNT